MKNKVKKIGFLMVLVGMLLLTNETRAYAKESETYRDMVSYSDDTGDTTVEDETLSTKHYTIVLDKDYKVTFEINALDDEGGVSLSISQGELNYGFYDDIYLLDEPEEVKANLKAGTYDIQLSANYNTAINYELKISYQEVDMNKVTTKVYFGQDSYRLDLKKLKEFEDGEYSFSEDVHVESSEKIFSKKDLEWSIDKESLAYVDQEGQVVPSRPGTLTLTASLPDGTSGSCKIEIPEPTCKISTKKATVYQGKIKTLKVSIKPMYNEVEIKWKSSNKKIATVNQDGEVKGKKLGTCTITAVVAGQKLQCEVTVKKKPSLVELSSYLNRASDLKKTKNASFSFTSNGKHVTYFKISGEYATYKGLAYGDILVYSDSLLTGYTEIDSNQGLYEMVTKYYNYSTGETVAVSTLLGFITKIEYWS